MKNLFFSLTISALLICGIVVASDTILSNDNKNIKYLGLGGSEREPSVLSVSSYSLSL